MDIRLHIVSLIFSVRYYAGNLRHTGLVGSGATKVWRARFYPRVDVEKSRRPLWLHVAGPGDAQAFKLFFGALTERQPELFVYVTYGSVSAKSVLVDFVENSPHTVGHSWLPFDIPFSVSRFLNSVNPAALILLQGEFWNQILIQLSRRGIPVIALRVDMFDWERQCEFPQFLKNTYKYLLTRISHFSVRHPIHCANLQALGVAEHKISVGGDYRLESPPTLRHKGEIDGALSSFLSSAPCVLWAGPRWDEFKLLWPIVQRVVAEHNARLILAAAEIDVLRTISKYLRRNGVEFQLRSRCTFDTKHKIILLDTIGEVLDCCRLVNTTILGDTFPPCFGAGRNHWEPLSQGSTVIAGPGFVTSPETSGFEARRWLIVSEIAALEAVLLQEMSRNVEFHELVLLVRKVSRDYPRPSLADARTVTTLLEIMGTGLPQLAPLIS